MYVYITVGVLEYVRTISQRLVLVWGNCNCHWASKVTEWLAADGNTETIYFLPFTPLLNHQEHVWKAGGKAITHKHYTQKIEEAAKQFSQHIENRRFHVSSLGLGAE